MYCLIHLETHGINCYSQRDVIHIPPTVCMSISLHYTTLTGLHHHWWTQLCLSNTTLTNTSSDRTPTLHLTDHVLARVQVPIAGLWWNHTYIPHIPHLFISQLSVTMSYQTGFFYAPNCKILFRGSVAYLFRDFFMFIFIEAVFSFTKQVSSLINEVESSQQQFIRVLVSRYFYRCITAFLAWESSSPLHTIHLKSQFPEWLSGGMYLHFLLIFSELMFF